MLTPYFLLLSSTFFFQFCLCFVSCIEFTIFRVKGWNLIYWFTSATLRTHMWLHGCVVKQLSFLPHGFRLKSNGAALWESIFYCNPGPTKVLWVEAVKKLVRNSRLVFGILEDYWEWASPWLLIKYASRKRSVWYKIRSAGNGVEHFRDLFLAPEFPRLWPIFVPGYLALVCLWIMSWSGSVGCCTSLIGTNISSGLIMVELCQASIVIVGPQPGEADSWSNELMHGHCWHFAWKIIGDGLPLLPDTIFVLF